MTEREIFLAALDLQDPTDRERFLAQACGGDAALRAAVDALFASHQGAGEFLQTPLVQAPAADAPAASASDVHEQTVQLSNEQMAKNAADDEADDSPSLQFLSPSTKPGSLGRLAHYEVLEILGRGAFGTVMKAFDEKLHRMVAIKVMSTELAATSPARKRFLREARSSAAVRHENVVAIHAVEEQPLPYLVMEYIPGQTLQQALDGQGPFELADILRLGQQIASGLAAAHFQGLIHRDIKPANILLEDGIQWKVKITDFGLARAADDASVTQSGMIAGTPMFMSPEQAHTNQIDQRSDLFSFGSVLYQMASGRPPFRAPNTLAVLRRVTEETPHPIQEIIPETPDWLCTIISKLHEKRPEDRYQTAQEVADLLARCQSELQLTGKVTCVTPNKSVSSPHPKPAIQRTPESPTPQTAQSGAWGKVLGGLLVLAVLIPTVWIVLGPRAQRPAETSPVSTTPITSGEKSVPATAGWHGWPADAPAPALAPFDAEQAKKHQEEWAAYLKVPVEYTNSIGMKFRLIPPGEFTMGSTPEEIAAALKDVDPNDKHWQECIKSEAPQHKVILTQPIYLGMNEVTQSEYERIMGVNPSHFALTGTGKDAVAGLETADYPVEMVSWNDAAEFCSKLSQKDGQKPFYFRAGETVAPSGGTGYRLPSEAEWEYACRAGTTTKYWIGDKDEDLVRTGWFGTNSGGRTHAAGELQANPFGLYDIHGNVSEWMQDGWDATYYGQFRENFAINPINPFSAGSQRVFRGGGWIITASRCQSSHREDTVLTLRNFMLGFRVSLPVDAVKAALAKPVALNSGADTSWHGWPADAPKPAIAPFDAEQAKKHQEEWAAYLKVPVEYTNSIGMKFRLIPPGEFTMGSTAAEIEAALVGEQKFWQECIKSEAPQHKVILTQPIYLGVNEVTQADYGKMMGPNPSHFAPMGMGKDLVAELDTTSHPVEMVSWNEAAEFCAKLSQQEKLKPFYFRAGETITPLDGTGYRLPSEAEWEFACRAGTATKYWIGDKDEDLVRAGWFGGNSGGRTHAVGELKANPLGLYDIHGNVWEWAQDGWDASWYGQFQEIPAINPNSPFSEGSMRLLRGGGFYAAAKDCRSSDRNAFDPRTRNHAAGFRVALVADAVRTSLKLTGPAMQKSPTTDGPSTKPAAEMAGAETQISTADPERFVAEWVLAQPGEKYLSVVDSENKALVVRRNEDLPSGGFHLTNIQVNDAGRLTDDVLSRFGELKGLYTLQIGGSQPLSLVTDKGFERLFSPSICKTLGLLIIHQSIPNATAKGFLNINRAQVLGQISVFASPDQSTFVSQLQIPKLTALGVNLISPSQDSGGMFAGISSRMPDLTSLGTAYGFRFNRADFEEIATLELLESLILTDCALDDDKLRVISDIPRLKHLEISYNPEIADTGLAHLHKLKALQYIALWGNTKLTDAGVAHLLAELKKLTVAELASTAVGDESCKTLASLPSLVQAVLSGTQVTDAGIEVLSSTKTLNRLDLDGCKQISDTGLDSLAKISSLTELYIRNNPQLTEPAVRKLQAALPKCRVFSDYPDVAAMPMPAVDPNDSNAERKAAE